MRRRHIERLQRLKQRDGRDCHLCGLPIWFGAPIVGGVLYLHPCAPTVDHIVPRAHGGPRSDERNMRLAHKWCNNRRGTDPIEKFRESLGRSHTAVVIKELVRLGMMPPPAELKEACFVETFKL